MKKILKWMFAKKIRKVVFLTFISIVSLLLLIVIVGVSFYSYGMSYEDEAPEKVEVKHYEMETIKSVGKALYDKDGNKIQLKGVNFGNWLNQEGWMSVNSIGPMLNEDGSYVKINDQGTVEEYLETPQEDINLALKNNPNLTDEQIEELWNIYYDAYCQEIDFKNIKDSGLNMIRLPMYYRNFMEGDDDNLVMKEKPFERIDWFLEMAKKYDLYVILDMHGVPGGQNGYEHSGTFKVDFWDNQTYIDSICLLWSEIAKHYKNDRPDLSGVIAAYDLINEPDGKKSATGRKQWDVMDQIYDAIREVDKDHVISVEGCWYFISLPDPEEYGWENMLYQYHFYNWFRPTVTYDMFYTLQFLTMSVSDYDVPKYVGEFTFFNDKTDWIKWLNQYDQMGWNWSFWNYKTCTPGWWDSSWGMYVQRLHLYDGNLKLDLRTATYDEIKAVWADEGTIDLNGNQNYEPGLLIEILNEYFEQAK